jgi:hypothetical protein
MPDAGEEPLTDMADFLSPELASAVAVTSDGRIGISDIEVGKKLAFQQASPELGDWAARQLQPMAMGAEDSPTLKAVGWHRIPSTYVVCSEDRSIQPEVERLWARTRATETIEVPFDHCPQISHLKAIADILARLAQE